MIPSAEIEALRRILIDLDEDDQCHLTDEELAECCERLLAETFIEPISRADYTEMDWTIWYLREEIVHGKQYSIVALEQFMDRRTEESMVRIHRMIQMTPEELKAEGKRLRANLEEYRQTEFN